MRALFYVLLSFLCILFSFHVYLFRGSCFLKLLSHFHASSILVCLAGTQWHYCAQFPQREFISSSVLGFCWVSGRLCLGNTSRTGGGRFSVSFLFFLRLCSLVCSVLWVFQQGVFFVSLILSAGLFWGVCLGVCLGRATLAGII